MPNIRWLLALITHVHRFLYRATNGRIGSKAGEKKMLLLTTIGRRSGKPRVVPLLYDEDGDRFVVIGSNAGDTRHPAWWLNLRSNPEAEIQIGPHLTEVRARAATGEEYDRLWTTLVSEYRWYDDYRARAGREIPVILLERRA